MNPSSGEIGRQVMLCYVDVAQNEGVRNYHNVVAKEDPSDCSTETDEECYHFPS